MVHGIFAYFQLKDVSEKQEPYCRKAEMIIKHELNEGRNRMAVVRSGSNFFDVIKSEQKAKVCSCFFHKTVLKFYNARF